MTTKYIPPERTYALDVDSRLVRVGDWVAYQYPGYRYRLLRGTVEKITPKGVTIKCDRSISPNQKINRRDEQICLIRLGGRGKF